MTVKEQVLELFENNPDTVLSGTRIADELGVSRNAVWKAVKSLQEEGYDIDAVTNKGYTMKISGDIMSVASVRKYIGDAGDKFDISVVQKITSTNDVLKEEASNGAKEGRIIIAMEQTKGKGRMERPFYSPLGTGIYLSILMRPDMSAKDALFITTAAAVAVAKAVEELSEKKAQIKWVNDIYCDGKKVCGILTEASLNIETLKLDYAVLGIGINIMEPEGGFPDEIKDIASAVFENGKCTDQIRSRMAGLIIKYFWEYYEHIEEKTFMEEYKNRSYVIGKEIYVITGESKEHAVAVDIDDEAHLIVKMDDGTINTLSSGEVSTKVI